MTWVENPDYHKQNGISALKAREQIHDNFLLLMADHIFEPETAKVLMQQPLAPGEVILAVDPSIDRIFDLDDATKVRRDGGFIVDIGKEIPSYDALDTGMFLCSPALFDALESTTVNGNCSLSDGMRQLARERRLRALEIGEARLAGHRHSRGPGFRQEAFSVGTSSSSRWQRGWPVSRSAAKSQLPRRAACCDSWRSAADTLDPPGRSRQASGKRRRSGLGIGLVIVLGGLSHLVKTWAWRITLLDERRQVSFARMFGLRLARRRLDNSVASARYLATPCESRSSTRPCQPPARLHR